MVFRLTRIYLPVFCLLFGGLVLLGGGSVLVGKLTVNDVFVFERQDGGRSDSSLYLYDYGHHKTLRLTHMPGRETRPRYAPDGSAVLFGASGLPDEGIDMLYVMGRYGEMQRRVLPCQDEVDYTFSRYTWTPDSDSIVTLAYERYSGEAAEILRADVQAMTCTVLGNDHPVSQQFMDTVFEGAFAAPDARTWTLSVQRPQEGFWYIILKEDEAVVRSWSLGAGQTPHSISWAPDRRYALLTLSSVISGRDEKSIYLLDTTSSEQPILLLSNGAFPSWRPELGS